MFPYPSPKFMFPTTTESHYCCLDVPGCSQSTGVWVTFHGLHPRFKKKNVFLSCISHHRFSYSKFYHGWKRALGSPTPIKMLAGFSHPSHCPFWRQLNSNNACVSPSFDLEKLELHNHLFLFYLLLCSAGLGAPVRRELVYHVQYSAWAWYSEFPAHTHWLDAEKKEYIKDKLINKPGF